MRYIAIKSCQDCPNKSHGGGFARVAYVPRCDLLNKELGYTIGTSGKMIIAQYNGIIPDECPLPEVASNEAS
jgi:hypothetical protein